MTKIFWILAIFAGASAQAANINAGNWELEGGFSFNTSSNATRYTDSTETTSFYAALGAQYFLYDQLSVGAVGSFATKGVRPVYTSIGPVATKYFLITGPWAPYVAVVPLMWMNANEAVDVPSEIATSGQLGAKFFFTDELAFGLGLNFTYFWGHSTLPATSRLSLVGTFAAHF
jgi:hypothetical protein